MGYLLPDVEFATNVSYKPFSNDNSNAVRSLKQMLEDQRQQFEAQKQDIIDRAEQKIRELDRKSRAEGGGSAGGDKGLKRLESEVAEERSLREDLERTLQTVIAERDAARNELLAFSMKTNLSIEEKRALEDQRRIMKEEFERAQRNAEGAVREARASEKRFEALAEEMRQVMEERDLAFAQRDEARKQKAEEERKADDAKRMMTEAQAARDALLERISSAERSRDVAIAQKQSEEQRRVQCEADIEVFRQQAHTLQVERDAALRENESVLERLDQAIGARRLAVAARAEALKQAEETQKRCDSLETRVKAEGKRADELENKVREIATELDQANQRLSSVSTDLRDAHAAVQEYKDLKEEAERECEAARRQVRGLNEEMLSVLKARDLALAQRDDAFARQRSAGMLEYPSSTSAAAAPPPTSIPSPSQQQKVLAEAEELRAVVRAALTSLQQLDDSPTKSANRGDSPQKVGDVNASLRLSKADASELAVRIAALRDKVRNTLRAEREARQKLEALESRMNPLSAELDQLRSRARESEEALRHSANPASPQAGEALEALRNELRERIRECETLRDERRALYMEVKELTLQLNRATPQKREVDTLRERLRQVLADFDRVEAENRRLKGL